MVFGFALLSGCFWAFGLKRFVCVVVLVVFCRSLNGFDAIVDDAR